MRTVLRAALMASGAASWIVFGAMFGVAFARYRKKQQRELAWLRQGGRDA